MLATLALQLLLSAQPVPARSAPFDAIAQAPGDPGSADPAAAAPGEAQPASPAPAAPAPAQPAPPAPPAAQPAPPQAQAKATPAQRPFLSLLGAEPLRGGSAALFWGGWPSLGAAYAIGFSPQDDLGVFLGLDWARSELRVGALYRRAIGSSEGWDLGFRVGGAWYENWGATYIYSDNHSDRGLELEPALVASRRTGGGLFAASAEAPMTVTWKHAAGFLFSPKLAASYEVPVYPQLTAGARAATGYRAGSGDAPMRTGHGEFEFLLVVGYQLL